MTNVISSDERNNDAYQLRKTRIHLLLADTSHHIEFNGHLSNHNKHAVVALDGLGASVERIEEYYHQYVKETTYGFGLEPKRPSRYIIDDDNCLKLLGQRTSFSSWCDYFSTAIECYGLSQTLEKWMPILIPGWVGAFTHATIHLGWGLDYGHPQMIIEGLAYMAFSWVSCHPERQSPALLTNNLNAIESLITISTGLQSNNAEYQTWVKRVQNSEISPEKETFHAELKRSGLQFRIAVSLAEGHMYIDEIPSWILNGKMEDVWLQLHYAVALIYLEQPGNFVNLHLITSLHAIEEIAYNLPEDQHRNVVRCFWQGMIGILLSSGDFPDSQILIELNSEWENKFDDIQDENIFLSWQKTVDSAIEEAEEHNPKLVYVAQKMWKRTVGLSIYREVATHFTSTPELPESFSLDADSGI